MRSAEAACAWLCDPSSQVSCHYLVDEEGRITQMVEEGSRAWHAGRSFWKGETDINSCSIGIEVHNPGHGFGYRDFPGRQMEAVIGLSRDIIGRHGIRPERVLAHSDVAPGRKIDPGEKFDWRRLHEAGVGHWVEPSPLAGDEGLKAGDAGGEVEAFQAQLASYGYDAAATGTYDARTERACAAFQRHFRTARIDGIADRSTVKTLDRLTRACGRR
jgi:N-acetylmuramoyl-L-alanine amidase